jgi:hypothetical protein
MREIDDEVLGTQIPEATEPEKQKPVETFEEKAPMEPKEPEYLTHDFANRNNHNGVYDEEAKKSDEETGMTKLGGNLFKQAEVRDGWTDFNRKLLGERNIFYPESWQFRIRPATVEAIRNWSTIDENDPNLIDDVFTEILKSCVMIVTPDGPIPYTNIREWDRFYFILQVREYTFTGENNGTVRNLEIPDECPNCENEIKFNVTSEGLMFDMPDPEVMKYYDPETCVWTIDPEEFDVEGDVINFYLPTLEKRANIKAWMISRLQAKKKVDQTFIKFLPWMAPKISKDTTVAARQIKDYETKFKNLDAEMFSLMDEIINNIQVTQNSKILMKCPFCGEEATTDIQFQDGIRTIFNVSNRRKKFGNK